MILIVNVCKEKLHILEFVRPIEEILKDLKINFLTLDYKEVNPERIKNADKIIICGTSLKDNKFLEDINKFNWIKNFKKPLLGICAGAQIISLVYGGEKKNKIEIGFYREKFVKDFLGLIDEVEVYHLHKNYCSLPEDFEKFTSSDIPQAIKHRTKEIYGVLFHPEVRNKKLVKKFVEL